MTGTTSQPSTSRSFLGSGAAAPASPTMVSAATQPAPTSRRWRSQDAERARRGGRERRPCSALGRCGRLALDLCGLGAAKRPLPAAHLDLEWVTERRERHHADLDARYETHFEQAPAKRARGLNSLDCRRL